MFRLEAHEGDLCKSVDVIEQQYVGTCVSSAEHGVEVQRSKLDTPPRVAENNQTKILWDLQIQMGKLVMADQPDIVVVVDKQRKKGVVIDIIAIPRDSNSRKKEQKG